MSELIVVVDSSVFVDRLYKSIYPFSFLISKIESLTLFLNIKSLSLFTSSFSFITVFPFKSLIKK